MWSPTTRVFAVGLCFLFGATGGVVADIFEFSALSMSSVFAKGRERTLLSGNAWIRSDNVEIRADEIEIHGKDFRFVESRGRVSVSDEKNQLWITCGTLFYDRKAKIMRAEDNAVLEDRKNEVIVKGQRLENREEDEQVTVQVGVRILKRDLSARSEFARYDRRARLLELSGLPVVYRKRDEYRAARIIVDLDTEEINLVGEVKGSITGDG